MHVNLLGIVSEIASQIVVVGIPVLFAVRLWKYLGKR